MSEYAQQVLQIGWGHFALAACAALYLIWWAVFFRPGAKERNSKALRAAGIACIVLAAICGVAGVVLVVMGLAGMPASIPTFILVAGGIALYVVLLGITNVLLDRPVTTELVLIVGWFVLEVNFLNGIASSGLVTGASLIIMGLFVLVVFIVCTVCYVLYYRLEGRASFIDGMVPLGTIAFVALSFGLLLR